MYNLDTGFVSGTTQNYKKNAWQRILLTIRPVVLRIKDSLASGFRTFRWQIHQYFTDNRPSKERHVMKENAHYGMLLKYVPKNLIIMSSSYTSSPVLRVCLLRDMSNNEQLNPLWSTLMPT